MKNFIKYLESINNNKLFEDKIFETTINNPNLSLVLPGGCNGKCDFCFWKKSTPCNKYLEKVNNVLNTLPKQFHQLSITGGEPTISPYLKDVLEMIDRKKFNHTVLTTNGHKLLKVLHLFEGKIDHVNISRHHYDDNINNDIFKSKMINKEELKNVTNELNKIGIDVTFSAVLNENLKTEEDISKYIKFAKDCGATQVFFRKPHGTLDPTDTEKAFENYKSKEFRCPVCRTKNQLIEGMKVSWKASLEEPSKSLGYVYELIVNENAELTKDWEGKLKIDVNKINENVSMIKEDCGGSSGCGGSDSGGGGCGGGYDDDWNDEHEEYKFQVGDRIKCIDFEQKKLSDDCWIYLLSKKFFTVLDINPNNKIDIGYVKEDGKKVYFSKHRFKKVIIKKK